MPGVLSKLIHVCPDRACDEVGHTWDRSCFSAATSIFFDVMRVSPGIYAPLYLVRNVDQELTESLSIKFVDYK